MPDSTPIFDQISFPFLRVDVFSFILHPQFTGIFLFVKIIFIIISLALIFATVLLLVRSSWAKRYFVEDFVETFAARPYGAKKAFKQWLGIQKRLEGDKEEEYKLALIEADTLLDDILKMMGYTGETLGEKLKQITSTILPNIDQVSQAHEIRNNIVHDPDYRVSLDLTKRALAIYEKAFQDLEVF